MKIKTKLKLNILLIILLVSFFVIILAVNSKMSYSLREKEIITRGLIIDVTDLNLIMHEYLVYREPRMEKQWFDLNDKIGLDLKILSSYQIQNNKVLNNKTLNNQILNKINDDILLLRKKFKNIIKNHKKLEAIANSPENAVEYQMAKKIEDKLLSQLILHSSQTVGDIKRYADYISNEIDTVKFKTDLGLILAVLFLSFIFAGFLFYNGVKIKDSLLKLKTGIDEFNSGDFDTNIDVKGNDELGEIAGVFNEMVVSLKNNRDKSQNLEWVNTGIAKLSKAVAGDMDISKLASKAISEISKHIGAQIGTIYISTDTEGKVFSLAGGYAYKKRKDLPCEFKLGEGIVGEVAQQKKQKLIGDVPENYLRINSSLGEIAPKYICVTPVIREGIVKGVVEVGLLTELNEIQQEYLEQAMSVIAVSIESAQSRTKLSETLEESQAMSEELQAQQEELKTSNEELEEQRQRLQQSEEELKVTNEELTERAAIMQKNKKT